MANRRSRESPLRRGWAPAAPLRRPVLFVNPASGGGKAVRAGLADRIPPTPRTGTGIEWGLDRAGFPWLAVVIAVPVALGVAVLLAILPGRAAARVPPGRVLRAR